MRAPAASETLVNYNYKFLYFICEESNQNCHISTGPKKNDNDVQDYHQGFSLHGKPDKNFQMNSFIVIVDVTSNSQANPFRPIGELCLFLSRTTETRCLNLKN